MTLTEYSHVENFSNYVSWVASYSYLGRISKGYHYKIQTERDGDLDAVFCCTDEFWDVVSAITIPDDVMVIVEGEFPVIEIDRFVFTNRKQITPFFLDVKARLHYTRLLLNLLDGVIQNKFDEMCRS